MEPKFVRKNSEELRMNSEEQEFVRKNSEEPNGRLLNRHVILVDMYSLKSRTYGDTFSENTPKGTVQSSLLAPDLERLGMTELTTSLIFIPDP